MLFCVSVVCLFEVLGIDKQLYSLVLNTVWSTSENWQELINNVYIIRHLYLFLSYLKIQDLITRRTVSITQHWIFMTLMQGFHKLSFSFLFFWYKCWTAKISCFSWAARWHLANLAGQYQPFWKFILQLIRSNKICRFINLHHKKWNN